MSLLKEFRNDEFYWYYILISEYYAKYWWVVIRKQSPFQAPDLGMLSSKFVGFFNSD